MMNIKLNTKFDSMSKIALIFWLVIVVISCNSPKEFDYNGVKIRIESIDWWDNTLVLGINFNPAGQYFEFMNTDFTLVNREGEKFSCAGFNPVGTRAGKKGFVAGEGWGKPMLFIFHDIPSTHDRLMLQFRGSNAIKFKTPERN